MFESKIKIRKELLAQAKAASESLGCSSVEEFVETVLEKELERINSDKKEKEMTPEQKETEDITNKLKGLGYID